jgi:hypothetical protein
MSRKRMYVAALLLLTPLLAAPTVGDVGGCGTEAEALDVPVYQSARKELECERCAECGVQTARCARACDLLAPADIAIPSTCRPLLHDGRVCVRALRAASCDEFARFVDDLSPSTPSECAFCRITEDAGILRLFDAGGTGGDR